MDTLPDWVLPARKHVTLKVDGETREVETASATVAEMLKGQKVGLLQQDRCSVPLKTEITDGLAVTITRIRTQTEFVHEKIAIPVRRRATTSVKPGVTKVVYEGTEGIRTRKLLITTRDGVEVSRKEIGKSEIAPQPKIILVGTRSESTALASRYGGNISRRVRRVLEMVATGYGPGENGKWGDVTCLGKPMGYGTVAVDPRVIRLGTRLFIPGYGSCVAGDVGGAIKGMRVDLGFNSRREAAAVGRRRVQVFILD